MADLERLLQQLHDSEINLFLRYVSVAILRIGPRPASQHHLFLQIIVAGMACATGRLFLVIAARDRAAGDDLNQRFRQRSRKPFAVVTRLALLRGINPEQADDLLTELDGVAFGDCEAVSAERHAAYGLGDSRSGKQYRNCQAERADGVCPLRSQMPSRA
jgi:hypothetical protein